MKNTTSAGEYAYCESVHATPWSRWHLRRLTEEGLKLGGGVDTQSLCGRVKLRSGWDLDVPISSDHDDHTCPACLKLYGEES